MSTADNDRSPSVTPSTQPKRDTEWSVSIAGRTRRSGRWQVPRRLVTVTLLGGVDLDLSEAVLSPEGVEIVSVSITGGVSVIVPHGTPVNVSGVSLFGGHHVHVDEVNATRPVVTIKRFGLFGGVEVRNPDQRPG